ncbi:MAG: magnesium chelatase [Deltaproteobacteria bacterium]|nr:MAG: magnesium chelatase [Deltaproteobacteria bacterium]
MFRFESPFYLLFLLFIPLLFFADKKGRSVSVLRSVPFDYNFNLSFLYYFNEFLKYLVIFFLVLAAANPQLGDKKTYYDSKGVNIMIAIDTSGSMRALDMDKNHEASRLDALKDVVLDFIEKRTGDRIGLVVFGQHAFTLIPLTRDYSTINYFLDRIHIGMAGENTAIGDALAVSAKRLEDVESKTKIVILVTDGESNSGEIPPLTAADALKDKKIKVYSIGIGSNGYAPFPADFFGRRLLRNGRVNIDEKTLKKISSVTGGLYFNGKNRGELEKIYSKIDALEKTSVKIETFEKDREYYLYFLFAALLSLVLRLILVNTKFVRIP